MLRKRVVSLFVLTLAVSSLTLAAASSPTDRAVETTLARDLAKYPAVAVKVEDRVAILSGAVERFAEKQAAERKAKGYGAVTRVVNQITVQGVTAPDADLAATLARKLAYDRTFQDSVFNWFTVSVDNGRVTVGGKAYSYPARDSALALAASVPGVKDLVDKIEILPTSMYDDQIRVLAARRIYSGVTPAAALDPMRPVRIIVEDGRVTLEGRVNTQVEKQLAESRIFGLPGVFSVTNNLVVGRT